MLHGAEDMMLQGEANAGGTSDINERAGVKPPLDIQATNTIHGSYSDKTYSADFRKSTD
jgi:hypothetical protein